MNHWSILPLRYRRRVSRTSEGSTGFERLGVALAVKLPIARSLVVGTTRAGSRGRVVCAREAVGVFAPGPPRQEPEPGGWFTPVGGEAACVLRVRWRQCSPFRLHTAP